MNIKNDLKLLELFCLYMITTVFFIWRSVGIAYVFPRYVDVYG